MRIIQFYMALSMLGLPFLCSGQTFQKEYFNNDNYKYSYPVGMVQRPDGALLAVLNNQVSSAYKGGVTCFQPDGTPLWATGKPSADIRFSNSVMPLPDNGFACSAAWNSDPFSPGGSLLMRFNANGAIDWTKNLPLHNQTYLYNLELGGSQSIYVTANTQKSGYVANLSSSGTVNWEKEIQQDSIGLGKVVEQSNGNLLLVFDDLSANAQRLGLIELSPSGDFLRSMAYNLPEIHQIVPLSNGQTALSSIVYDDQVWSLVVTVLDPQLQPIWAKKMNISGVAMDLGNVVPTLAQDSLSILFNNHLAFNISCILTLGLDGTLSSSRAIYSMGVTDALRAPDNGLYIAGSSTTDQFIHSALVKTDALYNIASCPPGPVCNLDIVPYDIQAVPQNWSLMPVNEMVPFNLSLSKVTLTANDFCREPPISDASFFTFDSLLCLGDATTFFAINSGDGIWTFEHGLPAHLNTGWFADVQFDTPGAATITHVTTLAGCFRDTATQTIQVFPRPNLELSAENTLCAGDSILITPEIITPGIQYKWSDGLTTPQRLLDQAGTYILEALSPEACKSIDTTILYTVPAPTVQIEGQAEACMGETIVLQAATDRSGLKIEWNTGIENAELDVQTSGLYSVQVHDGPCTVGDTMRVFFKECPTCTLFVPNVFAPGSGGANDHWAVQSNCVFSQYQVQLYDRWGNLVFQSAEPNTSWDGMYKGKILPPGVYVCRIDLETDNGDKRSRMQRLADVTIVR
jgi:gliding motility-associated-like protein